MLKSFASLGCLAVGSMLFACGGGDSSPSPARIDKASTGRVTQSTMTAMQSLIAPQQAGAANPGINAGTALGNAAQGMQAIAQPQENNGTATQSSPLSTFVGLADVPQGATGTCTCDATSCNFQACSYGGVTMDGSFSWGNGHVQANALKYTVATSSANVSTNIKMQLDCDITVTATSLVGSMHTGGDATIVADGKTITANWDTGMKMNNVTFPQGGGAPTGGSVHVDASVSASGNGNSASYAGAGDVTFP